jgi:hypothetical protein
MLDLIAKWFMHVGHVCNVSVYSEYMQMLLSLYCTITCVIHLGSLFGEWYG